MPRDLLFFRRFAIDTDRAVLYDQPDLGFAWQVLEAHDGIVLADLLDVPLDLVLPGMVAADPEFCPHIIPDQHRERLCCPTSAPDRPGVVDQQLVGCRHRSCQSPAFAIPSVGAETTPSVEGPSPSV